MALLLPRSWPVLSPVPGALSFHISHVNSDSWGASPPAMSSSSFLLSTKESLSSNCSILICLSGFRLWVHWGQGPRTWLAVWSLAKANIPAIPAGASVAENYDGLVSDRHSSIRSSTRMVFWGCRLEIRLQGGKNNFWHHETIIHVLLNSVISMFRVKLVWCLKCI